MVAEHPDTDSVSTARYYSPALVARAKYLYLTKSLQPRAIAEQLGVDPITVQNWTRGRGWAAKRRVRLEAVDAKLAEKTETAQDELMLSLAPQTHELAEETMEFARETLRDRDAKGLALTSQALKNFVSVYRTAKGLDSASGAASITFNAFYAPTVPATPKPAESIDVATTPVE